MRRSKWTSAFLCTALAVFMLTACSNSNHAGNGGTATTEPSTDANQGEAVESGPAKTGLPISQGDLTLKFFIDLDSKVGATMKSYNEIAAFQEMEKRTGIHIDFQHPPVGQTTDQLNLMRASNSLPDIVFYNWPSIPGGAAKAIADKSILKLNDLVDKYAPNFKKILETNEEVRKMATLNDGTIYMFPVLWIDPAVRVNYGFQIRKDWLDKLGLKVPETIDEWYTILKAFRETDPNGNGDPTDEIPFVSSAGDFRNFSGAWGINASTGFYQQDGKIKYSAMEPAFKDFLETMAKWYKEGLIDPEYASTDGKMKDSKITSDKGGAFIGSLSANMGRYLGLAQPNIEGFDLIGAPAPIGPAGKPYTNTNNFIKSVPGPGAAISTNNKHPEETVKWLDYLYGPEGIKLINWGIEGESYVMKDGKPQFTDIVTHNPDGLPMDQAVTRYALPHVAMPTVRVKDANWAITTTLPQQIDAVGTWEQSDTSLLLPLISPDEKDSARLASIMNEVQTYEDEMINKIVMGIEPASKYEEGVETLKRMGIEEAIGIMQDALDQYNQKK